MNSEADALNSRLRQRGYRLTRQRRAVVKVVTQAGRRLSAAQACAEAQRVCPEVGLTTVYRTLDILLEIGAVRRVHLDSGCEAFAPATAGHSHTVICDGCRATIEFEDCNMSQFLKRIADRTGFLIEQHWLELVGRCPKCRTKSDSRTRREGRR